MATQTTHYNLTKPDPTDLVDISVLNGNADIIDQKIFEASQSGGSSAMIETSVEESATSAHAYAAGDHFIYNGTLYRATAAIAIGDTITPETNCTAVTVAGELEGKVDKVTGKQLSTEDYTTAEKTKLSGIEAQANKTVIDDTLTNTGEAADAKAVGDEISDVKAMIETSAETSATSAHAYAAGDHFIYNGTLYRATAAIAIGDTITPESNCVATTVMTEVEAGGGGGGGTSDYTQLSNKPQINGNTLTGNKTGADLGLVNAVTGKQLSTEDYTTAEKTKLSGIEAQANKTVIDSTLTQTGQAADAKAAGDAVSELRNTLTQVEDNLVSDTLVRTGATNTNDPILAGTYFYLDGVLSFAKEYIGAGATFTISNKKTVTVGEQLKMLNSGIKEVESGKKTCSIGPNYPSTTITFTNQHTAAPAFVVANSSNPQITCGTRSYTATGFDMMCYYPNDNTASIDYLAIWLN